MRLQKTLRALRAACLLTVTFLSIASIAAASPEEAPRWERATPYGGWIVDLERAPSAPRMLYAAAWNGSVFRSLDGGATWHRRKAGPGGDATVDIVVDPFDAGTVYSRSIGGNSLFRTRDGGLNWSQIAPDLFVYAFAADTWHRGVLFAAASDGLFRSDDGGDSWAPVAFEDEGAIGVAVDPRAEDSIFVLVGNSPTVWKSTDRGATWTPAATTASGVAGFSHFAFDPVRPEVLYLFFTEPSTTGSLLWSNDGGTSWSEISVGGLRDLMVMPDGTLLGATDYGLQRSSDGGATWVPLAEPHDTLTRVLASSAVPGELLAAGISGVWKSVDNGASWAFSSQGLLAQGSYGVAVAPTGQPAVFALAGISLSSSADQGATWTRLHSILDGPQPYVIEAFDPSHPQTIYGIDTDGQAAFPVVSTDGGRQWSKLHIPFNNDSGSSIGDIYLTMVTLDGEDDPASILVGGWFFLQYRGFGDFLLRSTDGGRTWKKLKPVKGIGELIVDPQQHETYHAVGCGGFFQSTNAGATWKKAGSGLPGKLCFGDRRPILTIDPQDPRRFYVGTLSKGVFASSDGGATFRAMNRGLETAAVASLLIDPTDSSKLYAGVEGQGVFRWNAAQRKWTSLNRGLPLARFLGVSALDPRNPSILYAASPVEGLFRLDLENSIP